MSCHVASHWVLLVANLKKRNWDFYDSMPNLTHRTPLRDHVRSCIIQINYNFICADYLDTKYMITPTSFVQMRYLQEDATDVLPKDIALWPLRVVEGLPTQDTGNDCGIFVMKYMEASVVEGPVDWRSHQTWGKDMPRIQAELVASFCHIFQSTLLKENRFNF
ncbi:hypothetical protein KSP40_PGU000638 [Platanthera guangdongensis]|uniref:Ubiquitin-like protease family profile domain-containing protein n=1 Tax=Platanthera guangdongensis TaxID=2320717 RepID=A0ABR2MJ29_9ASPA